MKIKKIASFFLIAALAAAVFGCQPIIQPPTAVTVRVTFNLNYDGMPTPHETKDVTVGNVYGTLPSPEREGYEHTGWFFDDAGGGELVSKSTVVTKTENHVLYAFWKEIDDGVVIIPPDITPPEIPEIDVGQYPYDIPLYARNVKFDIGAWELYLGGREVFYDIARAGFTYLIPISQQMDFSVNAMSAVTYMNYARDAGLKVMVNDGAISAQNGTLNTANAHLYKNHEAFMGNFILDEPFPPGSMNTNTTWINNNFGWIKTKSQAYFNYFPSDKVFYVNLLPSTTGGTDSLYFGTSWQNYMSLFLDLGLNWLSTDNYVLTTNKAGTSKTVKSTFLSNIETAKKLSVSKGVPFNNFILSVPHENGSTYYRDPTEAELRWQITVNQAYGVDSISYFTYASPYNGFDAWTYGDALISNPQNGEGGVKLAKYYFAKNVNTEAQGWAHVYKRYEWQKTFAVYQSGSSSYALFDTSVNKTLDNKISSGAAISGGVSGGKGINSVASDRHVLLGTFKDADGRNGYMLTNATDPSSAFTASATVAFSGYQGLLIYENGVPKVTDLDGQGKAAISLKPGEGKFLIPLTLK